MDRNGPIINLSNLLVGTTLLRSMQTSVILFTPLTVKTGGSTVVAPKNFHVICRKKEFCHFNH